MAAAPQCIDSHRTDRLGAEITELCAYIYAATYRLLVLVREFDEQQGWAQPGLCSCAHWLNFKCGIGMNAAREKVRVAHALKNLPNISASFERGELSYSKVRAMTRIANQDNEDYLLRIARHGTAHHMETLVQKFRRAERLQDVDTANRQHRDRYLDYHYDEDGCLVIKARLPAEQGALIVKALEKTLDDRFTRGDEVSAETPDDDSERESISARRADALAEVAETYLNGNQETATTADRYQVVVHVSAETPETPETPETSETEIATESYLEQGPHVSAETSRRIGCDCSLVNVVDDQAGEPLSIGRKTRSIPPAIRRALRFRDQGCRFPGCTHRKFVDGHHIKHWADGGDTSLDNLVQLCRHHHRLVHEGGYNCERAKDGKIIFTAPDNGRLDANPPVRKIDEDPFEWLGQEMSEFNIGPDTAVPEYYAGDRMDWDLAVAALFEYNSQA